MHSSAFSLCVFLNWLILLSSHWITLPILFPSSCFFSYTFFRFTICPSGWFFATYLTLSSVKIFYSSICNFFKSDIILVVPFSVVSVKVWFPVTVLLRLSFTPSDLRAGRKKSRAGRGRKWGSSDRRLIPHTPAFLYEWPTILSAPSATTFTAPGHSRSNMYPLMRKSSNAVSHSPRDYISTDYRVLCFLLIFSRYN